MVRDLLIYCMEWIGTVAFAVSGALVAIGSGLDLFGVIIVGSITAVGGGIMRDLLLGYTPPRVFESPETLLVAMLTGVVVFVVAWINVRRFRDLQKKVESINVVFDAIGLAAFSVTGVEVAVESGFGDNFLLTLLMGVMTGVGGGVLRDVLVNEKPYILTRHIYAVASILGSIVYYLLRTGTSYRVLGTFLSVGVTILIRLLAAHYRWSLPKISFDKEK
ncbi:MAG: trimeric intracellular cation channel family protein [Clostridia bacterium]|nr:trimeric intracellular cation channel family protein [Clostridia bacterium]